VGPVLKRYFLQAACFAVVGLMVQGCAPVAPGFASAGRDAAQAVSPSGYSTKDIDPPPAGAITEITPTLIRAQNAALDLSTISPEVKGLIGEIGPYRIGPGDVLGIDVLDHPEIVSSSTTQQTTGAGDIGAVTAAPGYIVTTAGRLSFPFVGVLDVSGMTVDEVQQALVKRLARVFRDPQVSVRVNSFRSQRAYLEGEFRTPGVMVFSDIPMTLAEAINRAGGLTTNGDRSAIDLTRGGKRTQLSLIAMAEAGIDPGQIPLKPGDLLYVHGRDENKVAVMGEVTQQLGVPMRSGRLSLADALVEAGGVNLTTANPLQIYVVRNEKAGGQAIFHLDAKTPTAFAMADGFALRAKDVVYVDPVPLVQWNRVLTLVLPTATTWGSYRGAVRSSLP
jgi:polysaccharide export outer membrane protein